MRKFPCDFCIEERNTVFEREKVYFKKMNTVGFFISFFKCKLHSSYARDDAIFVLKYILI